MSQHQKYDDENRSHLPEHEYHHISVLPSLTELSHSFHVDIHHDEKNACNMKLFIDDVNLIWLSILFQCDIVYLNPVVVQITHVTAYFSYIYERVEVVVV